MSRASEKDEIRQFLVRNSFLGALPEADLDRLLQYGVTRRHAKGDMLLQQDEADGRLILILEGAVKIYRVASDGRETVLNFLKAGDVLGEIAVLDGGVRSAGAEMMEAGAVFILQRADILPVLLASPDAMREVVELLCEKIRMMSDSAEAGYLGVEGRFASGLLRLAHLHGRRTARGVEIALPANQRDFGAYMGLSRESASRQIARFAREGVLRSEGKTLIIRDLDRIRALAGP